MIRQTLTAVKAATHCVFLPDANLAGAPRPTGTGFFVSSDGWFVTAAHVICEGGNPQNPPRSDLDKMTTHQPLLIGSPPVLTQHLTLMHVDPINDFAFFKADFAANANKDWLASLSGFPSVEATTRPVEEGAPVYSYGFPLSGFVQIPQAGGRPAYGTEFRPRVTSAIVASGVDTHGPRVTQADPVRYVIDKALNYGNSGGPIVAAETGEVFAICTQFQPLRVQQSRLIAIEIPSLYGVVSSFSNQPIVDAMVKHGIPFKKDPP